MKHKFFVLLTCLSALLLVSCEQEAKYKSGMYYYRYYLVNGTSSTINLEGVTIDNKNWEMAPNDTVTFVSSINQYTGDELIYLHRPSLEDGYHGEICQAEYKLTYQNKTYTVDESQKNSFAICANYQGIQNPKSDFIYDYYFIIDEDYIATLPLKN